MKIWQVDGNYIRNNMDTNFNNSGHHYNFKLIPKHELWIDKDFSKQNAQKSTLGDFSSDEELLMKQSLDELKLIRKGHSLYNAINIAAKQAQKDRNAVNTITKRDAFDHLYVKKLTKYSTKGKHGVKVWVINGKIVRDLFYIHFTEGGHHYVYKFVPKNEIWIDDSLNPLEYGYVLFHEAIERNLMKYDSQKYALSHDIAIKYEEVLRKNKIDVHNLVIHEISRTK